MYEGSVRGGKGGDGHIKRLNCLTGRANLKPFDKRKCLLNLSISGQSLVPLVEQWGLMHSKAWIDSSGGGGLNGRQRERNIGGGGEVGMVLQLCLLLATTGLLPHSRSISIAYL